MATFNWTTSTQYLELTSSYVQPSGDVTITLWVYRSSSTVGDGYELLFMPASEPLHLYYAGWSDEMSASRKFATGAQDAGFSGNTGNAWEFWKFHQDGGDTTSDYWTAENDGSAATRSYEDEYAVGSPVSTAVTSIVIGANDVGTEGWLGALAHIAIWDGVLTATQLTALEGGANPVAVEAMAGGTATLDLYFPLWDLTEYVNSGTLTNNGSVGTTTGPTVDGIPLSKASEAVGTSTDSFTLQAGLTKASEAVATSSDSFTLAAGLTKASEAVGTSTDAFTIAAGATALPKASEAVGTSTDAFTLRAAYTRASEAVGTSGDAFTLRAAYTRASEAVGTSGDAFTISGTGSVAVDRSTTHQTMSGSELTFALTAKDSPVISDVGSHTGWRFVLGTTSSDAILDEMIDEIVALGVHRMRFDVHTEFGFEGTGGSWSGDPGTYTAGTYSTGTAAMDDRWIDAVCDVWYRFRLAVIAAGGTPEVVLQVVSWRFTGDPIDLWDNPSGDEGQDYADCVMSFLERARVTHGLIPEILTPCNEPDNRSSTPEVTPTLYRQGVAKLAADMAAVTGTPYANTALRLWEGQDADTTEGAAYLSEINTNAPSLLTWPGGVILGFHPYTDTGTSTNIAAMLSLASTYSIPTVEMGEYWDEHMASGATIATRDLLYDLVSGDVSAYEMAATAAWVWTANPDDPTFTFGWIDGTSDGVFSSATSHETDSAVIAEIGPYAKYAQPGAVRVDTSVTASGVRSVAWYQADGSYVVVVEDTSGSGATFDVSGFGSGWSTIELDDGATVATQDPAAVVLSSNELAALIYTPTAASKASDALGTSPDALTLGAAYTVASEAVGTSADALTLTVDLAKASEAVGTSSDVFTFGAAYTVASEAVGTSTDAFEVSDPAVISSEALGTSADAFTLGAAATVASEAGGTSADAFTRLAAYTVASEAVGTSVDSFSLRDANATSAAVGGILLVTSGGGPRLTTSGGGPTMETQ